MTHEPVPATLIPGGSVPSVADTWVSGRYRTIGELGRGGQGLVEEAIDRLTGDRVAVKWIPIGSAVSLELARREVTSLMWLRLPGVVRLRDDGVHGGYWFIVMDLVDGTDFPGDDLEWAWDRLRSPMIALLRALVPVHDRNIVHGDLKPANVRVRHDGSVVLLDFGIAVGAGLPCSPTPGAGTFGFLAPERSLGLHCDGRTDLFAVGRMVHAALGSHALPPNVRRLLDTMMAPDPECRPASALAVLHALGADSPVDADTTTEHALRALFAGPEHLLHLPSDAARILWQCSGGNPARVADELSRWEREGLAVRESGQVRVGRLALERIERRPEEARLDTLLRDEAPIADVVTEALRVARWWKGDGRPLRAMAIIDRALPRARAESGSLELELLVVRTGLALTLESLRATDDALVELGRSPDRWPVHADLESLLRAMRAAQEGPGDHADHLANLLPVMADEELEIWRAALVFRAALRAGRAELALAELAEWATTPGRRARLLGWEGNVRYRQRRYAESASCWLRSLDGRTERDARLAAQRNAAMAFLEVPDLQMARTLASLVVEQARVCGHEKLEAYATRVVRVAEYRLGEPLTANEALVDAAAEVEPSALGLIALAEAAIAWRRGDMAVAARIARRGERAFREADRGDNALLCRAMVLAGERADPVEWERVCAEAAACRLPEFGVQIFALAWRACDRPPLQWREAILARAAKVPRDRRSLRLDILSVDEAIATCDHVWVDDASALR